MTWEEANVPRLFNSVMLELTYRCNLACRFCYLRAGGRLNSGGAELSARQVKKIVARFPRGTDFYLSGGEPLLRDDLPEIAAFIRRRGSRFGVNTNGTLLTGAVARRLAALSPEYVIFSLHGPEKLHDALCGAKGAWRSLVANMAAFARLAGPRTEIIVNCVVTGENAGSLAAVYRIAAKAGAHRVIFSHLQFLRPAEAAGLAPALKAGGVLTPTRAPAPVDVRLVRAQLEKLSAGRKAGPHLEVRPLLDGAGLEKYYNSRLRPSGSCLKALDTLNVEPDGSVRLCVSYGLKIGDALKTGLGRLAAAKKRKLSGALPPGCARCCHRFSIFRHF
jgi:MoaA/NifB/PqqE/SkfB family radical SAM enzyme